MASVSTYLNFARNTEEAFNFYKSVFWRRIFWRQDHAYEGGSFRPWLTTNA